MSHELAELVERAKSITMSDADRERQRRSFAYGNTKIEDPSMTKETIDRAAEELATHGNNEADGESR